MRCIIRRAEAADVASIQKLYFELVGNDPNVNVDEKMIESIRTDVFNFLFVVEVDFFTHPLPLITINKLNVTDLCGYTNSKHHHT